ncbi:PEP-CTERM sorting domain-containing protein [Ruficoccus sp. ZRK36]|uniref:PEP-CTERM sorting domain-containing protein n=1 Tax=Ruficoccus sp. ZRK36 TaxID=2866311 RepID=UPI001C738001|nr:PEP-CTERM sorting domain-containing protein [Ruficoccus sp. ZRK36]QYY35339.1 PEP-CTERM sorting domain-containing protein [Ruficoccus sp. ZRK36]
MNYLSKLLPLGLIGMSAIATTASAATFFSDDFEEYTAGAAIPLGSEEIWREAKVVGEVVFDAENDTGHYFSSESNKYAVLSQVDGTGQGLASATGFSGTTTGQMNFSFYDPSSDTSDWLMRISGNAWGGNGNTLWGLFMQNGTLYVGSGQYVSPGAQIGTYQQDTAYTISIVFNNSDSTLNYDGGSVASQMMDVYLNGELIGDDLASTGNIGTGTTVQNINFASKVNSPGTIYLDDISLDSNISIPEPSTMSALAVGLGIMCLAIGRRMKLFGRRS